jgi:hypothetical protein
MPFTTGINFSLNSGFTTGTDLSISSDGGIISGVLADLTGSFDAHAGDAEGVISGFLLGISGGFAGNIDLGVEFTVGNDFTLYPGYTMGISFGYSAAIWGVIDGALPGVTGGVSGQIPVSEGKINAALSDVSGQFSGEYDLNIHRYTISGLCAGVEQAVSIQSAARMAQQQASFIDVESGILIANAAMQPVAMHAPVDQVFPINHETCASVDAARSLSVASRGDNEQLQHLRPDLGSTVDDATPILGGFAAVLQMLELLRIASCCPIDDAGLAEHEQITTVIRHDTIPGSYGYTTGIDFLVGGGYTLGTELAWPYTTTEVDYRDVQWRGLVRHDACAPHHQSTPYAKHQCYPVEDARRPPPGTSIPIDPPPPPPPPPPEGHETLIIPTQSSYTMQHVISVVTLVGNVAVPVSKVSLALNADAFAWQFSAILDDPDALSLVEIVDNEPVKLKITIDGYIWHTIAEEIEPTREFGKQAITLKGRGLSALLGAPYEQPKSTAYGSDLTVQQLADMQLPVGWALDWTQVTWLVPANAWSYTNQSPIQALAGIANDTGSMLVPARDAQGLTMMPRYPYWPWDFAGATPDLVIPEAAIKTMSLRSRLGTQANGVYVHGGDVGGVLGWCRFNGTDGARLAETRSNNLMTDVIGCRALGSRILAGQYTQPIVKSLTTYLDGDVFPLAEIGMLAAITIGAETERGIINSVAIEATLSSVSQTIQIGEETPNVWALFKELLPRDPLLVGTLASTDGATSIMTLLDGGVISVRGTGTVGNKYYIRAGRIEGEAPTMAQNEIVV